MGKITDNKKLENILRLILTFTSDSEDEVITAHGRTGDLAYVVFGAENPKLYLFDTTTLEIEAPEFVSPGWSDTYWDSRNHGITWKTKPQVCEALRSACGLVEVYGFDGNGTIIVESLPTMSHVPYQSNAIKLVGELGEYGLKINVGGAGWKNGFSEKGLEKAVALMELYSARPEDC